MERAILEANLCAGKKVQLSGYQVKICDLMR